MSIEQYNNFFKVAIKNIQCALERGYLSIFAGAGISVDSNLPSWETLMKDIYTELYGQDDKIANDSWKNEDFLVLAEKFYTRYGENYYYQKLDEYIPYTAKPNDLHRSIVSLDIKNLITTNWDNLFEKAVDEEGRFFSIIRKDEDLGSVNGFTKLIKMHGSLENRNIVFKESDYLEYSHNFPLIENYVKGIFSTEVVLIMGYSLSDINVKQIISWVKSRSISIKPIYFIKDKGYYDEIEFEFYKNKNIYVLYLEEFFKDSDSNNMKNKSSKKVREFINELNFTVNLKSDDNKVIYRRFFDFVNKYKSFKFFMPELFVKDLSSHFGLDSTDLVHDKFNNIIHINKDKLSNFSQNDYLALANLIKISIKVKEKIYSPKKTLNFTPCKYQENFIFFNYEGILKEIKSLPDASDENEIKKVCFLSKAGYGLKAFYVLKKLSRSAFKNKNYYLAHICELNKQNVLFNIFNEESNASISDEISEITKDISKIDTNKFYYDLPKNIRSSLVHLYNISKYSSLGIFELNQRSTLCISKAYLIPEKDRVTSYVKDNSKNIEEYIKLCVYYIERALYLEKEHGLVNVLSSLYNYAIEGLVSVYRIDLVCGTKLIDSFIKNHKYGETIFFAMINYLLSVDNLVQFLPFNNIVSSHFEINKEKYCFLFENICNNLSKNKNFIFYIKLFENFLILSCYIKLEEKYCEAIIENIIKNIIKNKEEIILTYEQCNRITDFIVYQNRNNVQNKNTNSDYFNKIKSIVLYYIYIYYQLKRQNIMKH